MKSLSTSFTFFIIITVPIVAAVCIVFMFFFILSGMEYWIFAFVSAATGASAYWFFGDVKKVEMDYSNIYVSSLFQTEKLPIAALNNVYEDKVLSTSFIRIRFKYKTKFGQEIKFIPRSIKNYFHSHPTFDELRKLIR